MKLFYRLLFVASIITTIGFIFPHATSAAFDISKGIVGNLASADCRDNGNCGFCDFIDLFVVLEKVILSLFGGVAMIMLLWGGISMSTAGGNDEKFTGAKKIIVSTLFGVFTIFGAYVLIHLLILVVVNPSGSQGTATKLFKTNDWYTALCIETDRTKDNFCVGKQDGEQCGETADGTVCLSEKCEGVTCTQLQTTSSPGGSTYVCKSNNSCSSSTPAGSLVENAYCPNNNDICCLTPEGN